jgi:fructose-1,6-bisphosphatase I
MAPAGAEHEGERAMTEDRPTLRQFLLRAQEAGRADRALAAPMEDIAQATRKIAYLVGKGALGSSLGSAGTDNVQGEVQKKLDILSNEVMVEALSWSNNWAGLVSEEVEAPIILSQPAGRAGFLCLFDPLDGSSNIDVNGTVGTIFAILRGPDGVTEPTLADFLQPGTAQVAAGFTVYGPSTIMVLTTGHGVDGFTLDRGLGEYILTHPDMRISDTTKDFTVNISNRRFWTEPMQRYIDECIAGEDSTRGIHFNMRWVGSMVADVFRLLISGGIFLYPWDSKVSGQPGKLRLLYEVNPMSFIIEQAGGASITGTNRSMEIVPTDIHERTPAILGSKAEVERVRSYHLEGLSETI